MMLKQTQQDFNCVAISIHWEKKNVVFWGHSAHCQWISFVPFTGQVPQRFHPVCGPLKATGLFSSTCNVNQRDGNFLVPPIVSDLHQTGLFSASLSTKFCWNPCLCNSTLCTVHTPSDQLQLASQPAGQPAGQPDYLPAYLNSANQTAWVSEHLPVFRLVTDTTLHHLTDTVAKWLALEWMPS